MSLLLPSLPHSLYLPLLPSLCCLLREAASVCFSLSRFLIRCQWKSPLNRCRRKRGRRTGRTIRGEFIGVAQSVITPVPLSLPPAATSLPCHRATDYSPNQSPNTHTHTHSPPLRIFAHVCSTALLVCLAISERICYCALLPVSFSTTCKWLQPRINKSPPLFIKGVLLVNFLCLITKSPRNNIKCWVFR